MFFNNILSNDTVIQCVEVFYTCQIFNHSSGLYTIKLNFSKTITKKLREIGELLPFASYLLDGCLGITNRGSPPDVFLYKALWEYAANLQENTIAKVWLHSILHGFFTINLVHVFRTQQFNHFLFYNNTSGGLLLCWKKPKLAHAIQLPVDTGRKLNVHKTFRRRPGRLLNVSCRFNLPPVSTGLFLVSRMFLWYYVCVEGNAQFTLFYVVFSLADLFVIPLPKNKPTHFS